MNTRLIATLLSAMGLAAFAASQAATNMPPCTPSPSWETAAALRAKRAARSGLPGFTSPQASMKICPPICSATARPF